jgi:hypothetical protein
MNNTTPGEITQNNDCFDGYTHTPAVSQKTVVKQAVNRQLKSTPDFYSPLGGWGNKVSSLAQTQS